jgi:hypothetical protein
MFCMSANMTAIDCVTNFIIFLIIIMMHSFSCSRGKRRNLPVKS